MMFSRQGAPSFSKLSRHFVSTAHIVYAAKQLRVLPRGEEQLQQGFQARLPGAELSGVVETQTQVRLQRHFESQGELAIVCF